MRRSPDLVAGTPRGRARARNRLAVIAALTVVGAAAFFGFHTTDAAPSAELGGSPLVTSARSEPGQPITAPEKPTASTTITSPGAPAIGDLIDLDHVTLVGDHYEAPLKDGRRATLTLDPDLQPLAEKLLDEARAPRGAIVAMAPDGRILALAGRRTEEPKGAKTGTFDYRLATELWAPAASVWKLVTASALVAAGVSPDDKVCFHGGIRSIVESNLHDSKADSRCESLTYGVAHSNNAILGKLAVQNLAPAALAASAHALGMDRKLADVLPGSDLPSTTGQFVVPAARDLELARTAAGFSGSQLSVVGGALLAATFADDGDQPVPHLIESIDGVAIAAPPSHHAIDANTAKAVAKMMSATCEIGSAAKSFGKHRSIRVAGKTGTLTTSAPFYMENSWFVGYAPVVKPTIIVSVLLGNPENWHLRGHEAARKLIDRATAREKDRTGSKVAIDKRRQW